MSFEVTGSSRELALSIIYDYLVDLEKPCRPRYNVGRFEWLSYSRWAAGELIFRIIDSSSHPICVLEDFICEMYKYSKAGAKHNYIFSIAQNVAENILEMCRAAIE